MNSIFTRRSVREYQNKPVEPEKIERILRAAMQAPSARNRQPWEFLVVTNPEKIASLAATSPYAKPASKAPVLILALANLQIAGERNKMWPQDLSASVQNLMLQAVEEGLGSCWMGVYPVENICTGLKKALDLPAHIMPFAMISVGYGAQENKFVDRFLPERVHYESY